MVNLAYYGRPRTDIVTLLPETVGNVLEIGAGTGATINWLRQRWPQANFTAVDGNPDVAPQLENVSHKFFIQDLNRELPVSDSYDLILALDVLEHLIDPWQVARSLSALLANGGTLIVSLPNISRLSIAIPLLLRGRFEYQNDGILDRTHLRFFTPSTAVKLIQQANLTVVGAAMSAMTGYPVKGIDLLTLGLMRKRLGLQTILSARRDAEPKILKWVAVRSAY